MKHNIKSAQIIEIDISDTSDLGKILTLQSLRIIYKLFNSLIPNQITISIYEVFRSKQRENEDFLSNRIWLNFDKEDYKLIPYLEYKAKFEDLSII